jgi:hypothetical protein
VKIEAPWLIEATGARRAKAVRWELEESKSGAWPRLRLVVAKGLSYPVLIDPSWVTTGSLGTARGEHTATLLSNGKLLVAGGLGGGSSAELYDPATGSWSSTGSLGSARRLHTATLLPNGKVLVAGGADSRSTASSSAELYDPASGSWSSTGSLGTACEFHTATLLPNGKVLVAGGFGSDFLSSAELYDPASGSWSSTGSLGTAREFHTATLLPNGKVLVAGGFGSDFLSSAELYDQGLGFDPTWQPLLITVSPSILPSGSELTASGSQFEGISEASGGNSAQNSSSNYPLVQLLSPGQRANAIPARGCDDRLVGQLFHFHADHADDHQFERFPHRLRAGYCLHQRHPKPIAVRRRRNCISDTHANSNSNSNSNSYSNSYCNTYTYSDGESDHGGWNQLRQVIGRHGNYPRHRNLPSRQPWQNQGCKAA